MRRVIFLFLALLGSFKGLSVYAYFDQSCPMSHKLEEECSVYAHQVTKPMLGYFKQVTQKIDKHSAELASKNKQINLLGEKEIKIQMELNIKNEQIKQQGENIMKLQMENVNYKLKETGLLEDLKQRIEELQLQSKKEFKAKETELQRDLQSKNDQIRQLEENMKKVQMENMNYKSKEDSMAALQEEFRKQQVIIEELLRNLFKKENSEEAQGKIKVDGDKLAKCERELTSEKNTTLAKDEHINQLEKEMKKYVDKIEKNHAKSCIGKNSSELHTVTLTRGFPMTFEVLCNSDIAGPGWTVIQQRIRGGVNFYRDWNTYRNGFGDFWDGDFFLGLEKIHRLTTDQPHELYIHLTRFDNSTYFARYDEFAISGETDQYRLSKLENFFGNTIDELSKIKNNRFSTYDRNNAVSSRNSASHYQSGWWFTYYANCNLNGVYFEHEVENETSIYWERNTALKQVRMMIRPLED